jgi:nucleotide-binding universal stress UspA family protein
MPFERIVAATDFSAASARALRRAALLAGVHRAPLERLLKGDARTELARFAAAIDAGALVVGAHGRSLIGAFPGC